MISLSSGNEQFCTTMTQHIQSEMARLEQGLPRYDPNFTSKFKVSTERMLFYEKNLFAEKGTEKLRDSVRSI